MEPPTLLHHIVILYILGAGAVEVSPWVEPTGVARVLRVGEKIRNKLFKVPILSIILLPNLLRESEQGGGVILEEVGT